MKIYYTSGNCHPTWNRNTTHSTNLSSHSYRLSISIRHLHAIVSCLLGAHNKKPHWKKWRNNRRSKKKSEPMPTLKLLSFANRKIALWNCLMIYRQKESWNKHKIIINWSNNKISKRMNKKKTFQLLSGLNSPFDRRKW